MTTINYINLSLELWGCVICGVVLLCLLMDGFPRDARDQQYLRILLYNIGALLFDALALLLRGHAGALYWWGVRIFNFLAFSCNYALLAGVVHYLTDHLSSKTKVSRTPLYIAWGVCLAAFALVVLTQFFPIIYVIDSENFYHRADWFWLSHAAGLAVLLICAYLLVRYRAVLKPQEKVGLWSYVVLPILAITVQMFVYGLVISNLTNTVSIVVIFLFLQAQQGRQNAEQAKVIAEQENQLMQSRVAIMLSQIQPHFLYNSLNAIGYLCEKDPPAAKAAVDDFAAYLRGNLDSLKRTTPVPFEKELNHVRIYLSLEKMRFDEELNVAWDISSTDFLIPALTVQPLVENAVKYGVGKKAGGGTVTISSAEYPDRFEVIVSDDGVGYDPALTQADGRTHIGIDNVRARLESMVGGTLEIRSERDRGTAAVITVPKEAQT